MTTRALLPPLPRVAPAHILAALAALSSAAGAAGAAPPDKPSAPAPAPAAATPARRPWSEADPRVAADLRAGRPLVIFVVVPLCDGALIDCGSRPAGRPGDLGTNLYWGAIFGQRRFFDRKASGWEQVEVSAGAAAGAGPLLERVVYRRTTAGEPWGSGAPVEQILVFQAVHGAAIDQAVSLFWSTALRGGEVRFRDGDRERAERIHVAGYAGHNRMLDRSAAPLPTIEPTAPVPSFVIACDSASTFTAPLRRAGSAPLVMTRALVAPEGYVIDTLARALGENASRAVLQDRVIETYARWQRIPTPTARRVFVPAR